ncbi:hypothetical protein SAMN02745244_03023 [Tessaracoccus bendigoensis DSM 12906]|uniref:Uncharacterized protein n=1 Tax=Tessaracoccus bendigoensis DSM 12906 TaxID=1123357 RepID=A0A1M6L9B0_9ACTN|nr:hypothetical protein [Tessaracoccus bendigoensis]SHJ67755.1 hypothetical protein SAMN02745244_03023 [Tessaracoccus bendigoensis DSM 12906]
MGELRNYTPHKVLTYRPDDGEPVVLPQRGNVRLVEQFDDGGLLPNGRPLTLLSYGLADGLPEATAGVVFVVSQLVVGAHPEREDLVFPAGLVRNDEGDIVGFRYLARPGAGAVRQV